MGKLSVRAGLIVLAALAASCAGAGPVLDPLPTPRPECTQATATIYFNEESATIQPLANPLIAQLMERIAACEAAGGEVREIWVVAYPDSNEERALRDAEMRLRGQRVRTALVEAGAPADKIHVHHPRVDDRAVMQRRAEIVAQLW